MWKYAAGGPCINFPPWKNVPNSGSWKQFREDIAGASRLARGLRRLIVFYNIRTRSNIIGLDRVDPKCLQNWKRNFLPLGTDSLIQTLRLHAQHAQHHSLWHVWHYLPRPSLNVPQSTFTTHLFQSRSKILTSNRMAMNRRGHGTPVTSCA